LPRGRHDGRASPFHPPTRARTIHP